MNRYRAATAVGLLVASTLVACSALLGLDDPYTAITPPTGHDGAVMSGDSDSSTMMAGDDGGVDPGDASTDAADDDGSCGVRCTILARAGAPSSLAAHPNDGLYPGVYWPSGMQVMHWAPGASSASSILTEDAGLALLNIAESPGPTDGTLVWTAGLSIHSRPPAGAIRTEVTYDAGTTALNVPRAKLAGFPDNSFYSANSTTVRGFRRLDSGTYYGDFGLNQTNVTQVLRDGANLWIWWIADGHVKRRFAEGRTTDLVQDMPLVGVAVELSWHDESDDESGAKSLGVNSRLVVASRETIVVATSVPAPPFTPLTIVQIPGGTITHVNATGADVYFTVDAAAGCELRRVPIVQMSLSTGTPIPFSTAAGETCKALAVTNGNVYLSVQNGSTGRILRIAK